MRLSKGLGLELARLTRPGNTATGSEQPRVQGCLIPPLLYSAPLSELMLDQGSILWDHPLLE